ncbi:MAG: FAD-dependent oxidoreductase [Clostridia bacterium]|nr:FAD-dependent oxidoreductase [Clostridia bacterium]
MGNSIFFETEDAGHEEGFKAPDFAHDISKMNFMKDIDKPENFRGLSCFGPHRAYEYGGQVDILNDHDLTELELRKLIYGIWDYVKNSGKYPQAKTRRLKRIFAKEGTRESRRFVGDYILNENDIENKVNFDDSVAIDGWPIADSLPKQRYYLKYACSLLNIFWEKHLFPF